MISVQASQADFLSLSAFMATDPQQQRNIESHEACRSCLSYQQVDIKYFTDFNTLIDDLNK